MKLFAGANAQLILEDLSDLDLNGILEAAFRRRSADGNLTQRVRELTRIRSGH